MRSRSAAFTLIELLVVITIIVVLLALLTPALDRAIYQAELAACGANLHAIGNGVLAYTIDHQRSFPDRRELLNEDTAFRELRVLAVEVRNHDLRLQLRGYVQPNHFADPGSPRIDLSVEATGPDAAVWANYLVFFGYSYFREQPMNRLGKELGYGEDRYSILAMGMDSFSTSLNNAYYSHVDYEGAGAAFRFQRADMGPTNPKCINCRATESRWGFARTANPQRMRPLIDRNVLWQDGSVRRDTAVPWDDHVDGSAGKLPHDIFHRNATTDYFQVPRN